MRSIYGVPPYELCDIPVWKESQALYEGRSMLLSRGPFGGGVHSGDWSMQLHAADWVTIMCHERFSGAACLDVLDFFYTKPLLLDRAPNGDPLPNQPMSVA